MEEPLLSETAVASHDWTRDNIRMQEQPLHIGMRVIGFFISLGLLGLAGVISYSAPFTQSTLTRGEDGQIELRIQRYMLFFIPIGEEQINDVKDVELKHVPRSDAALIIRTADGNRHLRTTFFWANVLFGGFLKITRYDPMPSEPFRISSSLAPSVRSGYFLYRSLSSVSLCGSSVGCDPDSSATD